MSAIRSAIKWIGRPQFNLVFAIGCSVAAIAIHHQQWIGALIVSAIYIPASVWMEGVAGRAKP